MEKFKKKYITELFKAIDNLDYRVLKKITNHLLDARKKNNTIFLMGNGGSSATPSHSAGDWTKELEIKTICLSDNTPVLTAFANDLNYTKIFSSQLEVFLNPGDIVIGYSGSGNSINVLNAIEFAKKRGNLTIGVTGNYNNLAGGKLFNLCDICVFINTTSMEIIEDGQLIINHMLKEYIKMLVN